MSILPENGDFHPLINFNKPPTETIMENGIKFVPLCFFSKRLEIYEYPASMRIFRNALILHFLLGFLVVAQLIDPVEGAHLILAEMCFTLVFVWLVTFSTQKTELFVNLAIAFIVCANIIGLLSFPFAFWLNIAEKEIVHLPFYTAAILMIWYLAVVGFLLHWFLEIRPLNCFYLMLAYFLFAYVGAFGFLFM